jgi:hypothetical protein
MSVEKAGLSSGVYVRDNSVKVTVWPARDDGTPGDVPEGFVAHDGGRYVVRVDGNGDVLRDDDGNAGSITLGQALVEYPDGTYLVIDEDNVERFLRSHQPHGETTDTTDTTDVDESIPEVSEVTDDA